MSYNDNEVQHQEPQRGPPNELSRLVNLPETREGRWSYLQHQREYADSIIDSFVSKDEHALGTSSVGERLAYNEYTTIDWLHDLVKDSYRLRLASSGRGLRGWLYRRFDACSGWIAVAIMGALTACVAFVVDVCEATVSDWKLGYCSRNPLLDMQACCKGRTPLAATGLSVAEGTCADWHPWSVNWWKSFGIYGGFALVFGVISATATTFTKQELPSASPGQGDKEQQGQPAAKVFSLAAGSGIPELKTFLSGFTIPHFLDLKVLLVKAFGAIFAVATGMCLGKEGPFVHISACVGYLVATRFPKYRDNGRKLREILSAAVAAGLSVAFGAPIGGVLFSYEEISTYFPRKILWRAFLCSMVAAIALKELNPTGTGKLVLFETDYGTQYRASHYLVFVLLGIAGGVWGGLFCKLNYRWSRWFRAYSVIKNNPVLEVFLVVLATVLLQYPNELTREPGDAVIRNLLVNCAHDTNSYVCRNEARSDGRWDYIAWLAFGCLVKLVLTIITFGAKVPSGIIIPALDAGALFGRLVGQWASGISPGIFAMVGAAAFLAGVSRMTISLCVIMFELTGELEYVLPHMVAILTAKWAADALSAASVYDLAQTVLGHPFLDPDAASLAVQRQDPPHLVRRLIPPPHTMAEIALHLGPADNTVARPVLHDRLRRLRARGLLDAGLVLVQRGMLQGYLGEAELAFGLEELGAVYAADCRVRLLGDAIEETAPAEQQRFDDASTPGHADVEHDGSGDGAAFAAAATAAGRRDSRRRSTAPVAGVLDLSGFVDRTPVALCEAAPMEYAVEAFGKLGLRHLMITEEGTGRLVGVCLKKRMLGYLEGLQ